MILGIMPSPLGAGLALNDPAASTDPFARFAAALDNAFAAARPAGFSTAASAAALTAPAASMAPGNGDPITLTPANQAPAFQPGAGTLSGGASQLLAGGLAFARTGADAAPGAAPDGAILLPLAGGEAVAAGMSADRSPVAGAMAELPDLTAEAMPSAEPGDTVEDVAIAQTEAVPQHRAAAPAPGRTGANAVVNADALAIRAATAEDAAAPVDTALALEGEVAPKASTDEPVTDAEPQPVEAKRAGTADNQAHPALPLPVMPQQAPVAEIAAADRRFALGTENDGPAAQPRHVTGTVPAMSRARDSVARDMSPTTRQTAALPDGNANQGFAAELASATRTAPQTQTQTQAQPQQQAQPQTQPPLQAAVAVHSPAGAPAAPTHAPAAAQAATPRGNNHGEAVIDAHRGAVGRALGVEVARRIADGNESLRVRLEPAELGRVDVHVAFDDDGMLRATVNTETHRALELLRNDSADLNRAMDQAGVRADAQSFRFESRGDGAGGEPARRQQAQSGQASTANGADEPAAPEYRPVRTDGRVDLIA